MSNNSLSLETTFPVDVAINKLKDILPTTELQENFVKYPAIKELKEEYKTNQVFDKIRDLKEIFVTFLHNHVENDEQHTMDDEQYNKVIQNADRLPINQNTNN